MLSRSLRRVAIGGTTSFYLGRLVSSRVPGVEAGDPTLYALTTGLIALVALAARLVPALRAARLSPMAMLKGRKREPVGGGEARP